MPMDKIKEYFNKGEFKIINGKVDSKPIRFITDKTNTLYAEVGKDKVNDKEEFEDTLLEYRDYFGHVQYISRIRGNNYYLYEIYIEDS